MLQGPAFRDRFTGCTRAQAAQPLGGSGLPAAASMPAGATGAAAGSGTGGRA